MAKALTIRDLLQVVQQEKLSLDTKIFLSSDEEGNNIYGMAEFGIEGKHLVLYPYNSEDYELFS